MPRLLRDLAGAEPVDKNGVTTGPTVTLPAGAEFDMLIRKLKRPDEGFEDLWSEIRVGDQLYRVPFRVFEAANAAGR
jgi:hypothetical protein